MSLRSLPITAFLAFVSSAAATDFTLLNTGAPGQALVPSAANGGNAAGFIWQAETPPSNIASWTSGITGVGYDSDTGGGGNYVPHIGLNVTMQNVNGSVFIRVPFTVNAAQRPLFQSLALRMRYDDGFVAWINGTKVTFALEPANLAWNSLTLGNASRGANLTAWEEFAITQHLDLLHDGTNMLAIQGLNATLGSSDLLMVPQLVATDISQPRWPSPVFVEVPGVGQLTRPVAIRNAADGSNRLFIVRQAGIIHQLSGGVLSVFMDINARVRSNANGGGNEQGLLGLAFPPGFAQSRRFYVVYTAPGGALTLSRFTTITGNPNAGNSASEQILLAVTHADAGNHNGGDIHFGTDGLLYWSTGDGGVQNDPANNAQNTNILLGKILRLDVEANAIGDALIPPSNPYTAANDPTGLVRDEIYHIGMRNPWRWSFDRDTGDMWVGDVGQNTYEEVTRIPANTGAANLHWRRHEALHDFNLTSPYGPGVLIDPVVEKPRPDISVTGGFVYRGRGFPRMNGIYFFGDYGSGNFYGVRKDGGGVWRVGTLRTDATSLTTFGEDEAGELYLSSSNRVYRITDSGSDSAYLSIVSNSINPAGRVTFTWGAANGRSYVPEVSTDLVNWTPAGPVQNGTATFRLTFSEAADPPAGTGRRYFRAREL